jgi:hypothetical protein
MLKLIRIHAAVPMENIYAEVGPKIATLALRFRASDYLFRPSECCAPYSWDRHYYLAFDDIHSWRPRLRMTRSCLDALIYQRH